MPSADSPRTAHRAQRRVLTNWQGAPCPACATPLGYIADLPATGTSALVLLRCDNGHCWQEQLSLKTLRSDLFVERRSDLEDGLAGQPRPPRTSP